MEVTVLQSTDKPEKLVCQAGRGDYYQGYVGDTTYAELMEGVSYDEDDVDIESVKNKWRSDAVSRDQVMNDGNGMQRQAILEAKTKSFIEKQLSRGHYGLWEHPQITFAVEGVSRVTMAQITRHRHLTFDVQSMRYADFSEHGVVIPATLLSDSERHDKYPHIYNESGDHFNRDDGAFEMSEAKRADWRAMYLDYTGMQFEMYQDMVDAGIPKEDARFMLPLGTKVNMTLSGNARTFLHLLNLRAKGDAQWEIRELSERLLDELFDWMPHTFNWYQDHKPHRLSP